MYPQGTLLILTLALAAQDAVHAGRIIGGKEARPHSRPYMVLMKRHFSTGQFSYCGGFLLREDFVMTAAHCAASSYVAKLGLHDISRQVNVKNISVEQAFIHEDYDEHTLKNDLMLLKLSSTVTFDSRVSPISVAGPDDPEPQVCSVAGWGSSDDSVNMTPILMEVKVTLQACDGGVDNDNYYCSKGKQGVGSGDSGGPLVCDGKVYGVVTAKISFEAVSHLFVKIQKHKQWIDSIMNNH